MVKPLLRFRSRAALSALVAGLCGTSALGGQITLPVPFYLEHFDGVAEGSLPAGWTQTNYSDLPQSNFDLQDLNSATYAKWTVVDRARFSSNFLSYTAHTPVDYSRVLSFNPNNVVNGRTITNLATGRFVFSTSGYRNGNQVMYLYSPLLDLTGRTNVYVSFHSLWEQNQDNFAALEYSTNGGATWLPIVYLLDGPDVLMTGGIVDAVKTFTNHYPDVAVYTDPITHQQKGGSYGTFIAAPVTPALATNISARVNDDPVESKRVELFRLAAADNQPAVKFRFAHAGTDSWYWGVDDFGLYTINPGELPIITTGPASVNLTEGLTATFSVIASGPGPLTYQWRFNGNDIANATNTALVISNLTAAQAGVYTVVVGNSTGAIESGGAVLSLYELEVTGQWDFDSGDLRPTVGTELEYSGSASNQASFPTVQIGGQPARVMAFGSSAARDGYYVRHGIKPNGGGHFVNQYTLLMDVMFPSVSNDHSRALFQTDPFNRPGNEADFLVGDASAAPSPNGIGAEGIFHGTILPDTWYRVAFAVDLTAPAGKQLTKYINGVVVGSQSLSGGVDGRFALGPAAQLFAAGLTGFAQSGFVNSLQFFNSVLAPETLAALGGPVAAGLPPGHAALRFSGILATSNAVALNWTGPSGRFQVQQTSNLAIPNWRDLGGLTTNRTLNLGLSNAANYYRVGQFHPDIQVGMLPEGEQSLPSKQILRAAGTTVQFAGRPVDLVLSPDGRFAYLKNINNLLVVEVASWTLLQTAAYPASGASMHGIALSPDGARVYVSGAGNQLYEWTAATDGTVAFSRTISLPGGSYPCGIAISSDGAMAYVCLSIANKLAVVNLNTGNVTQQINVGIAPYDVVLAPDGKTAYVSDWGGRLPIGGDLTAASAGTQVVIDDRGVAASGVVSFVNLLSGAETAQTATGLHPSDIELSADGQRLYVANANSDTVSVINTATRVVVETILVRPDSSFPYGSASTGLALSKDGQKLFVASAGNNAVAVLELPNAQHSHSELLGFVPTDWYPGAVVADSNHVYVANVKGLGTRLGQPATTSWQIGAFLGSASKILIPDAESVSKYTAQVFEDGRIRQIRETQQPMQPSRPPVPVPARVGEPSVFEHVVYILKENKTYDQVLGDLPQGNGDAKLCIYPRFVSPNHHALAEQYVLLDNFYCNGVNSSDGHSWSTEANVTDHLEKSFGGFSRSYSFGDDALTYSSSGFLWNNALAHGKTFRNYGEMDYASTSPAKSWLEIYQDYTNGTDTIRYVQNIGIASLRQYSSTNVPGWNVAIPDVVRARGFIKELNAAQAKGVWESLHLLYLPNDHTGGPPSARAQVADNDLSLGQVVEAITKSIFGSNTVIFVIEDDPQSGYDHVDGHRSICLVISPYTKRGAVISTFYNQAGVLHTMERILGLPAMNQQDAMSPLMFDCFTNVPDYRPYTALPVNIALTEGLAGTGNPSSKAKYYANKVRQMDLSQPDRINDDLFNRYIWHSIKGNAPYPVKYVGAHGRGLKALGLVLDKRARLDDDD